MEKLVVPIIPVYLEPHSKEKPIELPFPSNSSPITGGQLKESVMVCHGTPKNRQIVVVFDSNFAIDKIVHDESRLSDSDIANVCVLECRLGAVSIHVQVRWPKESDGEAAEEQIVTLNVSLDDKVSEIKRIIESMAEVEIKDSMILINDLEIRDTEKCLSHYHMTSSSTVKLIIIKHSDMHATPKPKAGPLGSVSVPNFRRGSAQHSSGRGKPGTPRHKMNPLASASTPSFHKGHSRAMQTPSTNVRSQRQSSKRGSLPSIAAPSKHPPLTANQDTRPFSNLKPLPAIGQKTRQAHPASTEVKHSKVNHLHYSQESADSEIGVEAIDERNEQRVVSPYTQSQSVRPNTAPPTKRNPLASASKPNYKVPRRSLQTPSTNAYSQRQSDDRPKTASLSSYDKKCTPSHTTLSANRSPRDFGPQRRKNQKERRKHHSEGSYRQTSSEDEAAVMPKSLPGSMYSNQERQFSDQYASSENSSADATESDEECDQLTAIYEDEPPLADGFDGISTTSNESLKDERLQLRVVVTELYQARVKWFHLGLQLQIEYDTLKSIREQNANNMDDCLCDMLHYWIKQSQPPPTWKTVIEALKSGPVNEGQLADKLEKKYNIV